MSFYPQPNLNPTLLDWTAQFDEKGNAHLIAEVLNKTNQILDDMTFVEGNLATGHRFGIRTGIPEPTWRRYYQGVQPSKSTSTQVQVSTGTLHDYAEVDKELADLNGNTAVFRLNQDKAKIEGFNQKVARYLFTGDETVEPEAITGFAPHYNSLTAGNAENIIDAGGTGTDNASIWLVGWDPATVYGIFPKGSTAGLKAEDKGQVTAIGKTANGVDDGYYEAYRTHYSWALGLCIQDWRYVVRIANIDRSLLTKDGSTGAWLPDLMHDALNIPPSLETARFSFYMDRTMISAIGKQIAHGVKDSTLNWEDVGGRRVQTFQGIPLRRVDALLMDEARVV